MARYTCPRCHATANTTTLGGHLCADLAKRLARQTKAVESVTAILERDVHEYDGLLEDIALDIVKALAGRDLGD